MLEACHEGRCGVAATSAPTAKSQGIASPQVVSAPSAGVPAARLRIAMRCAVRQLEGSPEFIPSTSCAFRAKAPLLMSPLH